MPQARRYNDKLLMILMSSKYGAIDLQIDLHYIKFAAKHNGIFFDSIQSISQ